MDVTQDACVQTERIVSDEERGLLDKVDTLQSLLKEKDQQLIKQKFRLMNIKMMALKSCFTQASSLTRPLNHFTVSSDYLKTVLSYSSDKIVLSKKKRRNQSLPPTEELFLTLIHLRVGADGARFSL